MMVRVAAASALVLVMVSVYWVTAYVVPIAGVTLILLILVAERV